MKLPKILKLCGHEIKIVYKDDLKHGKQELYGLCDCDSKTISLQKRMSKTTKIEVFIHETIHMIEKIYNLNLSERQVEILGIGMLSFFRDNNITFE